MMTDQLLRRYAVFLTIVLCLMSACAPPAATTPVATNEGASSSTQVTESAVDDSSNTTATSINTDDTRNDGISVTITGATNLNFTDGAFLASEQNDVIVLTLFADFQSTSTNVTINDLPYVDETPLTLTLANDDDPTTPSAAFVDGRDEFVSYSDNLAGTLTIDAFGETMSGSLMFTAEDDAGNSVTVAATFSGITVPENE